MAWNYRQNDLPTEVAYLRKLREKLDDDRYLTVLRRVAAWSDAGQNACREPQLKHQIMQIISWLKDDLESIGELNCILPQGIALLVPPRSVLGKNANKYYGTLLTQQGGEILSLEQSPDTGDFHVIFNSDDLLTVRGNNTDWGHCVKAGRKEGWGLCLADLLSREVDDPLNPEDTKQLAVRRQIELLVDQQWFLTHLLLHDITRTGQGPERVPCAYTFAERYRGEMGKGCAVCLNVFQKPKMRDFYPVRDYQFLRSVFREILSWCKLRHPNVLPFLGLNKCSTWPSFSKGRWTMIVPWIERKDILKYISENKPDLTFRRNAVCDIIQGLKYLHERTPPIFHGDLRAAQVLVDEDGTCLLIDFDTYRMTQTYVVGAGMRQLEYGNERWQAPEVLDRQLNALDDRAAADVYSLGCVMLEIYSGKKPQFADWDIRRLVVVEGCRPQVPSGIPEEILETIGSCWAREPSDRPTLTYLADEYAANRSDLSGDSTVHLDTHQRWTWKSQPDVVADWVAQEVSALDKRGEQMQEDLPNILYICVDNMSGAYRHSSKKPQRPAGFLRVLDEARDAAKKQEPMVLS